MSWLERLIDFTPGTVSHTERLVSTLGGCISIYAILYITAHVLGTSGTLLIVPSMGASAVLLFAVPHGALSQPWNLLGGHIVSALIGVSCFRLLPDTFAAAALAVGLAIGAMHYLRCMHPPGGATALAAVIGGDTTHALGYRFVITPILENVLIILLVAVVFNYFFHWRRYPVWLVRERAHVPPAARDSKYDKPMIEHADLVTALAEIDSFIDVSEDDLLRIYEIATGQARARTFPVGRILPGHFYSNGENGDEWAVRQVVDVGVQDSPNKDMVGYKVVAGRALHSSGVVTRNEFARWARFELEHDDDSWKRID